MTGPQIIWLPPNGTSFAASCEACQEQQVPVTVVIEGTLRLEADVGFTTCWRGHRIRVRRISRPTVRVVA